MKPAAAIEVMSHMRDEYPAIPPNERRQALQIGIEATRRILQIRGFTIKQVATFLSSEDIPLSSKDIEAGQYVPNVGGTLSP